MAKIIRGDAQVMRTLIADRRVDQGLRTATITGAETLTRHFAHWQSLSAAAGQDVNLPDATTLPEGWRVVVHASGASTLTVKDNGGTTIKAVPTTAAYEFICTDNATSDGTWYVNALEDVGAVNLTAYTDTFDATTDWGSPTGGYYTITVAGATHGITTVPLYRIFHDNVGDGSNWREIEVDQVDIVDTNKNFLFRVPDSPDLRFAGRYVLHG